ncbi:transposase [Shimia sp. R9_1]|uniref:transposase n=1 Tax=Shimia sp. R9_1 TaxID=2821111 RepID=UPI001FFDF889|nr:transposase [Shimia sp. R9_1]
MLIPKRRDLPPLDRCLGTSPSHAANCRPFLKQIRLLGSITKRGSRYLRVLFVQAAQVIMMRPKNWHKFSFGPWLEAAATPMQHNKLGVALANKLTPQRSGQRGHSLSAWKL